MRLHRLILLSTALAIGAPAGADAIGPDPWRIYFDHGTAEIRDPGQRILGNASQVMRMYAGIDYLIIGHTDPAGPPEANLLLSCRRALAVRDHLLSRGVAPERLTALGRGGDQPQAAAEDEAGIQERVEIWLVSGESRDEQSAGAIAC